jgi:5-methyltetrahydrofolate--homocysteine methyltransferase
MDTLKQIALALDGGDQTRVAELTGQAIEQQLTAKEILDDGLIAGMNVVGEKFRKHEIFLPHVLLAARAMYSGLDLLEPLLLEQGASMAGKAVIGSVQGDQHDIGKNLVGIMLKGSGFEVIDLGSDVAPERFVDAAVESGAQVIGMSALLMTTMPVMKKVVEIIKERGLEGELKTIIGGAPVSSDYAQEIGADAYAFDCVSAVERIKGLID